MRELGPFILLLCACGAAVREPAVSSPPPPAPPVVASADPVPPDTVPSFDALAARGPSLAPGMHEAARKEGATSVDLVKADTRDACVRVAYAASAPVTAKLVDHTGAVLATSEAPSTEGTLGPKGPVCIRKGDVVRALTDASGAHVRWVAWAAP